LRRWPFFDIAFDPIDIKASFGAGACWFTCGAGGSGMAEIDVQGVTFLKKIIFEAGRRGDFFIQQRDYASLMDFIQLFEVEYRFFISDAKMEPYYPYDDDDQDDDDQIYYDDDEIDDEGFLVKHEPKLDVDDAIWRDALSLAKRYKIEIPPGCEDNSAVIIQQDGDDAIGQNAVAGSKPESMSLKPFTNKDHAFTVEGWKGLAIKDGKEIDAKTMARHFLIFGETGSGKTESGIKPLLKSILNYENLKKERASALVIDPKDELREFVEEIMGDRFYEDAVILDLDKDEYRIDAFERISDRSRLTARSVIEWVKHFSEDITTEEVRSHDLYWVNTPLDMIRNVLEVVLYCNHEGLDFWAEFSKLAGDSKEETKFVEWDNDSFKKLASGGTKGGSGRPFSEIIKQLDLKHNPGNYFLPMKRFFDLLGGWSKLCWSTFNSTCKRFNVPPYLSAFTGKFENIDDKLNACLMTIVPRYLDGLTSHNLIRHIWLNPIEPPENSLRVEDAVNNGKVMIYSPGDSSFIADAIGRQIKARFFAATFARKHESLERPVAYVCDEFQRFITGDPESGEQSFLDRCRAYRGICVLATQSIASIAKALHETGENFVSDCISIILNNTGTKLFFRNTDTDNQRLLGELIPANALYGGCHIMTERPISTLGVGECYYLLSNSKWGRAQVSLLKSEQTGEQAPKPQTGGIVSAYCSTHKLMGDVTPESIVRLCDEIDSAVNYYQYRRVKIEICSPGGYVTALQHYVFRLEEWRKLGVIIETVALMSVASAAAMILSLGTVGYRKACPVATLLYHNSRTGYSSSGTKEAFAQVASELERIDGYLQGKLVAHVCGSDDDSVPESIDLLALRKRELNGKKMNHYLPSLDDLNADEARLSREHYEKVLGELFEKDMSIDPEDAKLLGLIDQVLG
jgi:ATP-dependent protease ClpP protease subunit